MQRRYAVGAVLSLVLAAAAAPAQAHPHHDAGAIAFISDRDSTVEVPTDEVYLIDPPTRRVHRLTDDLAGVERWPTISPDGRTLAWVRFEQDGTGAARPDVTDIYRCDLRSRAGAWSCRNPTKVIGPVFNNAISWTPDSRTLLYSGPANADADTDIYSINVRSGLTTNLTHEAVVDGIFAQNSQPVVSPGGRSFVYSRAGGATGADLYRRNIDGSSPAQLTAAPLNDNAPDYSPDGKQLVFHSNRDGDTDIYTMRPTVEGPDNPARNLTDRLQLADGTKTQERAPSYSPDGRQISFWWFTDPPTVPSAGFTDGEIYAMRIDGSHVRNLTNNNPTDPAALTVGDIQPDWGPSPVRNAPRRGLQFGFAG